MKHLKRISICIASLFSLFAIVYLFILILAPSVIDINTYKSQIEKSVKESTGLGMSIESISFKPSFNPYFNLYLHHLKLNYPNNENLLKVTDLNVKIKVLPLLFKKIQINEVEVIRPIASVTLYKDCSSSIDKYLNLNNQKTALPFGLSFDEKISKIKIIRYKLKIKDVNYGSPFIVSGDELLISDFDLNKKIHIKTKGSLFYNSFKHIDYDLNLASNILPSENKNGKTKKKLFSESPFISIRKYNLSTKVKANLKIEFNDKNQLINGQVDVNDLTLCIKNKTLSKNNFQLVFNSDTVQITANFFTSLKDKVSISGVFSYGDKKFVDLTVKALDNNLSDLQDFLQACLNSFNVKNNISEVRVTGLADLDFRVKSNLKKIESSGKAKVVNASINSKLYPFKITNINSDISFANNNIRINKANALVNSTPFEIKGFVNDSAEVNINIAGNKLPLAQFAKVFLPVDESSKYQINNGELTFNANIKGKLNKMIIEMNGKLSNIDLLDKKNKLKLSSPLIALKAFSKNNELVGDLSSAAIIINSNASKLPINIRGLKANFDSKDIILIPTSLYFDGSPFIVKGKVSNYTKEPDLDIEYSGKISSISAYKFLSTVTDQKASAKGNLHIVGKVNGKVNKFKLNMQILANKSNYLSYIVIKELLNKSSILNADLLLNDKKLQITDLSFYSLPSDRSLTSDLNENISKSTKVCSVSGNIPDIENIEFNDLKIFVPDSLTFSIMGLNGSEISLKSDLVASGNLHSPALKGNLIVNTLVIPDYSIHSKDMTMTFDSSNIHLKAPDLRIKNSNFDFTANIVPKIDKIIVVKDAVLLSSVFDLNSLSSSFSNIPNSQVAPGIEVPVKILSGKASISKFSTGNTRAENVQSNFTLDNNILKITKITGDAYGGKIWGNIDYNLLQAVTSVNLNGKYLDAAPSVLALTGIKDNIMGKLDFTAKVRMSGFTQSQMMQSLKGHSSFIIRNGQMGTFGKFEHFLYAQNILSQNLMKASINIVAQAVTAKNTGLFKYLTAEINFGGGYANIEKIESSGPNMSLYLTGKMNLLNNWADLEILGKVSHEVTRVLGPLGDLSISNIASNIPKLSSIQLPNIFFANFNTPVEQSTIDKIPDLTPKTDLKTKNFTVKIIGNIQSVKSVKSFKWIVLESEMPKMNSSQNTIPAVIKTSGEQNQYENRPVNNVPTVQKQIRKPVDQLPDFLNNLPDVIN